MPLSRSTAEKAHRAKITPQDTFQYIANDIRFWPQ